MDAWGCLGNKSLLQWHSARRNACWKARLFCQAGGTTPCRAHSFACCAAPPRPSAQVLVAEGEETKSNVRTSYGFWPEQDDVTARIQVRLACTGHAAALCALLQ